MMASSLPGQAQESPGFSRGEDVKSLLQLEVHSLACCGRTTHARNSLSGARTRS